MVCCGKCVDYQQIEKTEFNNGATFGMGYCLHEDENVDYNNEACEWYDEE